MLFSSETGIVTDVNASGVQINFTSGDACDNCGLKVVCAPGKPSERSLTLPASGEFTPGQRVRVEETSNVELHLAMTQFGLPLILFLTGLMAGYFAPQSILPKELAAFIVALLGLAISFFTARSLVQKITDVIPEKYLRIQMID